MNPSNAKPDVICLMGPTASGKTSLAVDLVQQHPFQIVSVDSAQIYQQMNIGTGKPEQAVLDVAPHRLIDFIDPALFGLAISSRCFSRNRRHSGRW